LPPSDSDPHVTLPAAVLWDMDGTLVDTEPYWIAAEHALVESFGGSWTEADSKALVGNPLLVSAAYIREHGGVDLPVYEIVDVMLGEVIESCRRKTVWRAGARELLAALRQAAVPCALVTMSYRELANTISDQLPAGTFAAVVTGDELLHGKPDPEAYVTAADRLGVDPTRCVAIEDSPTGLASARAAGCVVVGVPNQVPIPDLPERTVLPSLAGVTVEDLAALLPHTSGTIERAGSLT
jgi:HAD superfamily hydrolase (TIGR01509 family)